ncbi:orexin/Hypocretin receptor type 1-like [Haliotis rufescens]|uniref:orexin/Hypocretin receptor type 1-like n=1 Tax=Haliotis rufescens TaxID=6454 RepID=UPI00201F535C|nr:orexin/Hypocretin receptor type 1-like [Haliotis rufescens]
METLLPVSSSVSSSSITPTMETLLPVSSSVSSSSITPTMETLLPVSSSVSSSSITSTNSKHEQRLEHTDLKTVPKPKTPVKTKAGAPVVTKTTLVMFLIAVVFIFSFLPYLIIATLKYVNRHAWRQVGDVKSVVYQFFLKFHYVNSACNPIVYSFCGRRFRQDFRQFRRDMAYKLQCWIKQRDRR